MRRILLAWEIGASFGHLARLIPIARHAQHRGDEVVLAVRDPQALAAACRASPLTGRRAPRLEPEIRPRAWSLNYADSLMRNGYEDPIAVRALVDRWTALLDETEPDLVIAEHAPGALLAARERKIRRVAIGSGFTVPPVAVPQPTIQPWFDVAESELLRRERAFAASVNQALAGRGSPRLDTAADLFDGAERCVCTWPELDHYDGRPADEYAGPLADIDGDAVIWPEGAGPRVFFYGLGDRLRTAIEIAIERGCRCAVYRPLEAVPPSTIASAVTWLTRPADVRTLAAACDLVVCEAPGTATQFLLRGVPAMVLPGHLEQQVWAWRAAGRGLVASIGVFSRGDRAAVAGAFDAALSADAIRTRVHALAAAYAMRTEDATIARISATRE